MVLPKTRFIIFLTQCLLYRIISKIYIQQYKRWKLENKQTMHWKQNLSKTEQSVVICTQTILLLIQKFWNFRTTWEICILIFLKTNQLNSTLMLKIRIIFVSAKVSVFQQDQINYHLTWSQRLYLAQTLIKTQKMQS